MDKHVKEAKKQMKKTVESIENDLKHIRTGRPSPALLDDIRVDYYGTPTQISQLAGISVVERSLMIKPWDKNVMKDVEKSILASNLGLNPINDGTNIRLNFPAPTGEEKKKLARRAHEITEGGKVSVRNIRRDILKEIKKEENEGNIPEDEAHKLEDKIQELTDEHVSEMDRLYKEKEEEIMEV